MRRLAGAPIWRDLRALAGLVDVDVGIVNWPISLGQRQPPGKSLARARPFWGGCLASADG